LWSQMRNQVKASHCGLRNPRIGCSDARRNMVRAATTKLPLFSPLRRRRGFGCSSGPLPVNSRTSLRNSCLIRLPSLGDCSSGAGGGIASSSCRNCSPFLLLNPSLNSGRPISGATGSLRNTGTGGKTAWSCSLWSPPSSSFGSSDIGDAAMSFSMPMSVEVSRNLGVRVPLLGLTFFFLPPKDLRACSRAC
jgi:hypothetical protein